jgi:hypothetical protein
LCERLDLKSQPDTAVFTCKPSYSGGQPRKKHETVSDGIAQVIRVLDLYLKSLGCKTLISSKKNKKTLFLGQKLPVVKVTLDRLHKFFANTVPRMVQPYLVLCECVMFGFYRMSKLDMDWFSSSPKNSS